MHFYTDSLHSLDKLDICILFRDDVAVASTIFGLFQRLHDVKFLELNIELVQLLLQNLNVCPKSLHRKFANGVLLLRYSSPVMFLIMVSPF
ncbi:hypothetical protein L1987_68971 [Smallanthus sonchifolius]|uniref:Uncharacterized protein n=1 Tax=Smallanthus sonchifolius TaxID=185202 RepID=A0ACB9B5M9_9ASTR|nr:hypothetical protein L1987_68971 [Smallanthus sonchifolius]